MAYSADDTLSQDPVFQGRVRMATVHAAVAIVNEAATARQNVDRKRHILAVAVLNNPSGMVSAFTQAAIEANALVSASTDAQLDVAIASIWNGMAGVSVTD